VSTSDDRNVDSVDDANSGPGNTSIIFAFTFLFAYSLLVGWTPLEIMSMWVHVYSSEVETLMIILSS
jgi:hypothetical protein